MSADELKRQANEIERKLRDIRRQEADARERAERERESKLKAAGAPRPFVNDDYIGLDVGDLSFYYGYEVTTCPHKADADYHSCEVDDCDPEWCFQLKRNKQVIVTIPTSQLNARDKFSVTENLLSAIGLCISRGILLPIAPISPPANQEGSKHRNEK